MSLFRANRPWSCAGALCIGQSKTQYRMSSDKKKNMHSAISGGPNRRHKLSKSPSRSINMPTLSKGIPACADYSTRVYRFYLESLCSCCSYLSNIIFGHFRANNDFSQSEGLPCCLSIPLAILTPSLPAWAPQPPCAAPLHPPSRRGGACPAAAPAASSVPPPSPSTVLHPCCAPGGMALC